MLAAKVSILDEQVALRDKLTQSEQAKKTIYHKIIARRSSLSTHKVDSYATLVGQAVTHVEAFRKIEVQAKPLTKNIGGKRTNQKKGVILETFIVVMEFYRRVEATPLEDKRWN